MNQSETNQSHDEDLIERTIRDAGSIGKVWARYGLLAGKNALETSATTLDKVAGLLNHLATSFKDEGDTIEAKAESVEVVDDPPKEPVDPPKESAPDA